MSQFENSVKSFFKKADKDGNGCLSPKELYRVLIDSGFGGTCEDVVAWFDSIDKNKDKTITLEELLFQLSLRDPKSVEESELRAQFKKMDKDNSGKISPEELQEILTNCGKKGNAAKYISTVDKDNDGKINYEEFIKLWRDEK